MNRDPRHTLRILTTLAWEYWALGWSGILLAPLGALVLPSLIFGMLAWQYDVPFRDTEVGNLLQFSFYWVTALFLATSALTALGNPVRRYTLPASSLVLVAGPMACAMLTTFVQYAIVAMVLNAVFDAGWPIWGPGLLAAVLVAWFQAVLWSTSNSIGLCVVACLTSLVGVAFAMANWARPRGLPTAGFLTYVNHWHFLMFGLATLACAGVGTALFDKLRHGSGVDVRRIMDWLSERVHTWRAARAEPFSSATSAQFWLEWAGRGHAMPVGTALIGIVIVLLACCVSLKDGSDFITGFSGFFLAPLGVIGMFLGSRSPHGEFGNFNGSRPLPDCRLANAILKSATLGLILSTMIWAVFMAAVVVIVGEHAETSRLYRSIQQISTLALLARTVLGAAVAWSGVGFVTSLALAGRKVMGIGIAVICSACIGGVLLPLCLPREARSMNTQRFLVVCLVPCLLAAVATFIASWRLRLISIRMLWLAAVLVLTVVAAAYSSELFLHISGYSRQWIYLLPVLCGCGIIPIPLAAAPLAVYVNRHR